MMLDSTKAFQGLQVLAKVTKFFFNKLYHLFVGILGTNIHILLKHFLKTRNKIEPQCLETNLYS